MNPVAHQRSKHIDIKYHWIREHVGGDGFGTAECFHVSSAQESADMISSPNRIHETTLMYTTPQLEASD